MARACAVDAVRRRAEAPPLTVAQSFFGAKFDPERDGGFDGSLRGCRAAGAARIPGPCGRLALGGRSRAQKGIGQGERGKKGWPGLLRHGLPGFLGPRLGSPRAGTVEPRAAGGEGRAGAWGQARERAGTFRFRRLLASGHLPTLGFPPSLLWVSLSWLSAAAEPLG